MVKTVPAPLATHVQLDTTTLATGWKIVRVDGITVRVNTAGADVTADFAFPAPFSEGVQTYAAEEAVNRTNLEGTADMDVDNVEIAGAFDGVQFDEQELRRGLFNGAQVFIFTYNYRAASDGAIRMFRGFLGDARVSDKGFFFTELRNLLEVFRRKLGEHYSKDCRSDVGDPNRCRIPIRPDLLARAQIVIAGEFFRVRTSPAPDSFGCRVLILPFDGVDAATAATDFSRAARVGTFIDNAQIDTAFSVFGGASLLLDGAGDYVRYTDAAAFTPSINSTAFTIHCRSRAAVAGSGTLRTICSHYAASTNRRSYLWRINTDQTLTFAFSLDGVAVTTLTSVATITHDTFQHLAVTRDTSGVIRMFIDGVLDVNTVTETGAFHDSDTFFRIGAVDTGSITDFYEGHIDDFEFVNGLALWTAGFTPPASAVNTTDPGEPTVTQGMFENRHYKVMTGGTTHPSCQPTYDTTLGQNTGDGSAVLQAEESWMREAIVSAVDSANLRRKFDVTELTPNSGGVIAGRDFFPDDSMNSGAVVFETGNNSGKGMEIRDFIADDGVTIVQTIELFRDMSRNIVVGDKIRIFRGCDKTQPICVSIFDNAENAVAEWRVPGPDALGKYPDAR